jgi:uncharacterized protein (DUF58 family)
MMAPQSRLIFWVAVVVLPASLIAALEPTYLTFAEYAVGAFVFVAVADAFFALNRLDGVRTNFPDVIRLTQDKESLLPLKIERENNSLKNIRIGIAFPPSFLSPANDFAAALSPDADAHLIDIPCTPLRRGNYVIHEVFLEASSPLGLWGLRKKSEVNAEVRVYPNIHKEQKNLAALFLNRGMFGLHAQRQVGKGKEFEKLREYIPGDSYEDIHWKATAKRSHPVTKIFQIERTQEIYLIIDASRLSSRTVDDSRADSIKPDSSTTQLERFITAAMVLALVAEKQGDLFGLITFNDKVQSFIRARNGKAHYNTCRDALYALQPKMVNPDFNEVNSFIRLRLRRRALLIFLTNLDDPVLAENFAANLDVLSRHHLVLVNMLRMPSLAPLFSSPDVTDIDDLYQRMGGHLQFQKLRELEQTLKRRGVTMSLLDNESMCAELVSQYINVKRRQIL